MRNNTPSIHFKAITDFYQERITTLVNMLYDAGISQTNIAKQLGITQEAVSIQYPKEKRK